MPIRKKRMIYPVPEKRFWLLADQKINPTGLYGYLTRQANLPQLQQFQECRLSMLELLRHEGKMRFHQERSAHKYLINSSKHAVFQLLSKFVTDPEQKSS